MCGCCLMNADKMRLTDCTSTFRVGDNRNLQLHCETENSLYVSHISKDTDRHFSFESNSKDMGIMCGFMVCFAYQ